MAGLYPNVVRVVEGKPKGGGGGKTGGSSGPPKLFAQVYIIYALAGEESGSGEG